MTLKSVQKMNKKEGLKGKIKKERERKLNLKDSSKQKRYNYMLCVLFAWSKLGD